MKKRLALMMTACMLCFTACEEKAIDVKYEVNREEDRKAAEENEDPVRPEANEKPAEIQENQYVTIEVSWDESNVTFFSDTPLMKLSINDVCQPVLHIEGEHVEREVNVNGTMHTETLTVKDPDEYVNIFIDPCQPTNDCPLDSVTASITYTDGQVTTLTADEMKVRGQTGIWYLNVYTQN